MSEMVEKAAVMMAAREMRAWDDMSEDHYAGEMSRQLWRLRAVTAILAMREPTEEMLAVGDSMMPQIAKGEDITTGRDALAEAWPVMIDEALKP